MPHDPHIKECPQGEQDRELVKGMGIQGEKEGGFFFFFQERVIQTDRQTETAPVSLVYFPNASSGWAGSELGYSNLLLSRVCISQAGVKKQSQKLSPGTSV